jgi:hypothetical protein
MLSTAKATASSATKSAGAPQVAMTGSAGRGNADTAASLALEPAGGPGASESVAALGASQAYAHGG